MNVFRRLCDLFFRGDRNRHVRSEPGPTTCESEARRIAESWATEHEKLWTLPASATLEVDHERRFWVVRSNATGRGHRITLSIDDRTGAVVSHHEVPR